MNTEQQHKQLEEAVRSAVAFRLHRRLQPAGGPGDKVFPPTYEGGKYALETRMIDNRRTQCVLLDSVQSQANRMELALLQAHREKKFRLPVISVDFRRTSVKGIGVITSLEAPHRIADAILRDSLYEGKKFRESEFGKILETASVNNATELFGVCPTALLFGVWDSTGPLGGLGTKIQRAIVSEVFGVDIQTGVRTSSRIDPLQIQKKAGPLYSTPAGDWTLNETEAKLEKGKAVKLKKDGNPSEANHGNIAPTLEENAGGITMSYALQTVVLSLPMLRRLSFPIGNNENSEQEEQNVAARIVIAAMGLCGAISSVTRDFDLRSRCLLVPEGPAEWEIIGNDGSSTSFNLSFEDACELTRHSIEAAKRTGLPWHEEDIVLTPNPQLVALVEKSQKLTMESGAEGTGE